MPTNEAGNARAELFRDGNFRRIAAGIIVSLFGDHFTLVAVPWLVLELTGDSLAIGIVMIVTNVPRISLILFGGAMSDRFPVKRVLLLSQTLNGLFVGLLAVLVLTNSLNMWEMYGLALGIGFATAFSMPSWSIIVARTVKEEHLTLANSILFGALQISRVMGPLLAGALIAWFGSSESSIKETRGLGLALLFDLISFIFSLWAFSGVIVRHEHLIPAKHKGTLHSIVEGIQYFWRDKILRTAFLYGLSISFFMGGPMQVAMPVLAVQLGRDASALGILMSAMGVGGIVGATLFGINPKFRVGTIGTTILAIDFLVGILLLPMGQVNALWGAGLILFLTGTLHGFLQPLVNVWTQIRVPSAMLGRVMSVFLFLMMSVPLVSITITGWLMRSIKPNVLFSYSGSILVATVLLALTATSMRSMTDLGPLPEAERK